MKLELGKLGSKELKALHIAMKVERERRGKKNPSNHEPPTWAIPNEALSRGPEAAASP